MMVHIIERRVGGVKLALTAKIWFLLTFIQSSQGFPLASWDLDLDSGRVELQAGGVPGISPSSTVDCTKFTLTSNLMENDAFTLEGCTDIAIQGFRIAFDLTPSDLVFVKLDRNLATSRDTSFLLVESGNGIESSSNPLDFLAPTTVVVQADSYTRDSTRPQVTPNGFQMFDLDVGIFTLQFSEPVNATAPFIDTTSLSFQHHFNSTSEEDIFQVESLSCPECVDGSIVTLTFPPNE
ncbi:hypothetical protein GBAR_LOCUS30066, partial [Geodia barretti]